MLDDMIGRGSVIELLKGDRRYLPGSLVVQYVDKILAHNDDLEELRSEYNIVGDSHEPPQEIREEIKREGLKQELQRRIDKFNDMIINYQSISKVLIDLEGERRYYPKEDVVVKYIRRFEKVLKEANEIDKLNIVERDS